MVVVVVEIKRGRKEENLNCLSLETLDTVSITSIVSTTQPSIV